MLAWNKYFNRSFIWITCLSTLVACAPFSFPYRPEVVQGNIVTRESFDRLKIGMSAREVRYLLGSPLITDPFHPDRWDYALKTSDSSQETNEQKHITLYFKEDRLLQVLGSVD
ncbi:Outer membrane protein assembly factor BamE [Gammaproteobacteria bacterium]